MVIIYTKHNNRDKKCSLCPIESNRSELVRHYLHWQKLWENHEKKTEIFPQFSQNENIFVKIGE